MHANALILGHVQTGMGERIRARKLQTLLQNTSSLKTPIIDIIHLLGDLYEPLARLNYTLADHGHSLIEESELEQVRLLKQSIIDFSPRLLLILSWSFSVAALLALGLHHFYPTVATLCAHHPNEKILSGLYEPAALLITESLLANERGASYGIPKGKMLYLPHPYPQECDRHLFNRRYVEALAKRLGKHVGNETLVIGAVSRLDYGKNCEYALEAVRRLASQGHDVVLVLKGDFSSCNTSFEYASFLKERLMSYCQEPWLLWDLEPTSYPEVIEEYASFDLCLHLSGAECGSHVVGEWLALGKPVLVLNCSTHSYLYGDGVLYVSSTDEVKQAQLPFYVPKWTDLTTQLEELIRDKSLREKQGKKAREVAVKRFHPKEIEKRLEHLFERDTKAIEALYERDRKEYGM